MSNKAERDKILKDLSTLWEEHPNQRLGQLMENYVFGHHSGRGCCIFHIDDKDVIKSMKEHVKEYPEVEYSYADYIGFDGDY